MPTILGVALKGGEGTGGLPVELLDSSGQSVDRTETKDDGTFEFTVAPGDWTMRWTDSGGEASEGQVQVSEGEDAEIELEI